MRNKRRFINKRNNLIKAGEFICIKDNPIQKLENELKNIINESIRYDNIERMSCFI